MESLNRSFEPMDIDLSSSINDNMDISLDQNKDDWEYVSSNTEDKPQIFGNKPVTEEISENLTTTVKKYHIYVPRVNKYSSYKNLKIFASVILLGLSMIIAQTWNVRCTEEINIEYLKTDLFHKVYGQSKALKDLTDALQIKESKLIFFYGSTGVGKTYAASIIMESFGYNSNLYHYTMPSFNTEFSVDFLLGLTICKHSMFIIDGLKKDDELAIKSVKEIINKSKSMEKNVTIVLIYNCMDTVDGFGTECNQHFHKQLLQKFRGINILKKLIKFEQLTNEDLWKCIENELGYEKINTNELKNVNKYFKVATDGCKGVHAKVKLYRGIN